MLDHKLKESTSFGDVNSVAKARTLSLLRDLDGERKGVVVQFLRDSGLIGRGYVGVVLREADLSDAQLSDAELGGAVFYEVDFSNADMSDAGLETVDFRVANLTGADLSGADLTDADMRGATLRNADLTGAVVTDQQLASCASLERAILPSDPRGGIAPRESLTMMR